MKQKLTDRLAPTNPVDIKIINLMKTAQFFWPEELSTSTEVAKLKSNLESSFGLFFEFISNATSVNKTITEILDYLMKPPPPLSIEGLIRHVMLLIDMGATPLQNVQRMIESLEIRTFNVEFNGKQYPYTFSENNGVKSKKIENKSVDPLNRSKLNPIFYRELILILFFGSKIDFLRKVPTFQRLNLGNYLGKREEFRDFIFKRPIHISRQITQIEAVKKGAAGEHFISDEIERWFASAIKAKRLSIISGSRIPDVKAQGDIDTQFDLVLQIGKKHIAIEIAFQETSNSVIERKGGQARGRYEVISQHGDYIAYIVDGFGCFERITGFMRPIVQYSHFITTFGNLGLFFKWLEQIIKEQFG